MTSRPNPRATTLHAASTSYPSVSKHTAALQNILNDLHTAVMSGSKDSDTAIAEAQARAKNEVLAK